MAKYVDWSAFFEAQRRQRLFGELSAFVTKERQGPVPVYPGSDDVFGFTATPLRDVRVVVLGQDPYPGRGQAHGLAFSVPPGVRTPPSLQNIFMELWEDLGPEMLGKDVCGRRGGRRSGDLTPWTRQGVLLLNTALTVRQGEPSSHLEQWRSFTDEVVRAVVDSTTIAPHFILWGKPARLTFERCIGRLAGHTVALQRDTGIFSVTPRSPLRRRHGAACAVDLITATTSAHPSPLSADRGFFGSRPFSRANLALKLNNPGVDVAVDWRLP